MQQKSFGQSPLNWFMHLLPLPVCLRVHRGKKYSAVAHGGFSTFSRLGFTESLSQRILSGHHCGMSSPPPNPHLMQCCLRYVVISYIAPRDIKVSANEREQRCRDGKTESVPITSRTELAERVLCTGERERPTVPHRIARLIEFGFPFAFN